MASPCVGGWPPGRLVVGIFVGQWLAYSGVQSPAQFEALAPSAFTRHDYVEAAQLWTRAVSLQPHNAAFHYSRGTALARLGQRQSAADAYRLALLLDPPPDIARLVREGCRSFASLRAQAAHPRPTCRWNRRAVSGSAWSPSTGRTKGASCNPPPLRIPKTEPPWAAEVECASPVWRAFPPRHD